MLKFLRKTAALSLAAVPVLLSLPGVAQAEEIKVYTSLTDNYDVYIDPATVAFNGSIREFVQRNVYWEGNKVMILQQSINCSTGEIATRNTRRENLEGTNSRSSGRVGQFHRPKAGVEDFLVDLICGLEQPTAGIGSPQMGGEAMTSSNGSGLTPTISSGYSPVANLADPPICYMENRVGQMFDLTALCGFVGTSGDSGFSSFSTGEGLSGGSSGPCDTPDDIDSAGRRCGGRAASERAGGR